MPRLLIRKEPQVPNSTRMEARNPFDNLRGKESSMLPRTSRPDSVFETAYTARDLHQNSRGTLRFLPPLKMRPCSVAPNPVEAREDPPKSTIFLTSHRHPETLPEVTVTSQGNPGFPSTTQERPRDSPFNTF